MFLYGNSVLEYIINFTFGFNRGFNKIITLIKLNIYYFLQDCKRDWGRGFACAGRSTTNDKVGFYIGLLFNFLLGIYLI